MPLEITGSKPIVNVLMGGIGGIGSGQLAFRKNGVTKILGNFDTSKSSHSFVINPLTLLDPPNNKMDDLVGCELSWAVIFTTFPGINLSFSFKIDVIQDGKSLFSREITDKTASIMKSSNSVFFDGSETIS